MKRFGAACALAFAVIFLTAGCNDYGNTFQQNTGASLTSISPSNVSAGDQTFTTITAFGSGFVTGTVIQWNGHTLTTTPILDANSNILWLTAAVPQSLITTAGVATLNTLSPHSGSMNNGLSNTLSFIINPPPNPTPALAATSPMTPASIGAGSTNIGLTLNSAAASGNGAFLNNPACTTTTPPTPQVSLVNWTAGATQTTLPTTSVSATQIKLVIPDSLLASQGTAIVTVYSPPACPTPAPSGVSNPYSGGGGSSNGATFTITSDPPTHDSTTASLVAEEAPALGQDGRYVTYTASQNGHSQIFLRDTCTGAPSDCQSRTALLSAASDGTAANADSNTPSISSDGRFIAFSSAATNLVSNAPAGRQIYLRDTCAGAATSCTPQTSLISSDESGLLAGNDNLLPSISSSGRFVAFLSVTPSKYPAKSAGTPNSGYRQIFVRDTCFGATTSCTPKTTRISLMPGDANSLQSKPAGPAISSSAAVVGVSSSTLPIVFTRTVPVDDRVFLALTNPTQK